MSESRPVEPAPVDLDALEQPADGPAEASTVPPRERRRMPRAVREVSDALEPRPAGVRWASLSDMPADVGERVADGMAPYVERLRRRREAALRRERERRSQS